MVNPDELVDVVRDKLKAIPAVVELVGNDSRILSYIDDDDGLSSAVGEMKTPSILVAWLGNDPGDEVGAWIQRVGIFLQLDGRLGFAFTVICDSVATGDTEKFTEAEFHPDFEQLGVPSFLRTQDDDGIEHPNIDMRFRQRSI